MSLSLGAGSSSGPSMALEKTKWGGDRKRSGEGSPSASRLPSIIITLMGWQHSSELSKLPKRKWRVKTRQSSRGQGTTATGSSQYQVSKQSCLRSMQCSFFLAISSTVLRERPRSGGGSIGGVQPWALPARLQYHTPQPLSGYFHGVFSSGFF